MMDLARFALDLDALLSRVNGTGFRCTHRVEKNAMEVCAVETSIRSAKSFHRIDAQVK
jgi:hypothetical protein